MLLLKLNYYVAHRATATEARRYLYKVFGSPKHIS